MVIWTKFPEYALSTVSMIWFIHSISGITARSGPKQEKVDSEGRHGQRSEGATFEGNVSWGRETLRAGVMASNVMACE